jgi:lipoprotein signal peptidase
MNQIVKKAKALSLSTNTVLIGLFTILVSVDIGIAYIVKKTGIDFYPNLYPFNLKIPFVVIFAIMVFVTWGLFRFGFIKRYPVYSMLILTGGWSNIIERLFLGYVVDYINFGFGYANIADLQIWIGVLALNILTLTPLGKDEDKTGFLV